MQQEKLRDVQQERKETIFLKVSNKFYIRIIIQRVSCNLDKGGCQYTCKLAYLQTHILKYLSNSKLAYLHNCQIAKLHTCMLLKTITGHLAIQQGHAISKLFGLHFDGHVRVLEELALLKRVQLFSVKNCTLQPACFK